MLINGNFLGYFKIILYHFLTLRNKKPNNREGKHRLKKRAKGQTKGMQGRNKFSNLTAVCHLKPV